MIWRLIMIIATSGVMFDVLADETDTLRALEDEIATRNKTRATLTREAQNLARSVKRLKAEIIVQAKELREIDGARDRLEERLRELTESAVDLNAALLKDRRDLVQTLAALQSMERQLPPAFAVHPDDALHAVQGAIALASIVPTIQNRADELRVQLLELRAIRQRIDERKSALIDAEAAARIARNRLDRTMAAKAKAEQSTRNAAHAEEKKIERLVRKASNLKDLLAKLAEQERKRTARTIPSVPSGNFVDARGKLTLPVNGEITRQYGARQTDGQAARGLTISARGGAQITAPYDARVLYAGVFRQYGSIVILGIDERYQIVLAGLGKAQSYVGQKVLAGEPIGTMAKTPAIANQRQALYLELRYKGQPIDPTPWIANKGKG